MHGITISSMCSGEAMIGLSSTSAMVSGLSLNTAPGVWLALTRWSTTILAIAVSSYPYAAAYIWATCAYGPVLPEIAVGNLELGLR